jgi:hypothetical protein
VGIIPPVPVKTILSSSNKNVYRFI